MLVAEIGLILLLSVLLLLFLILGGDAVETCLRSSRRGVPLGLEMGGVELLKIRLLR